MSFCRYLGVRPTVEEDSQNLDMLPQESITDQIRGPENETIVQQPVHVAEQSRSNLEEVCERTEILIFLFKYYIYS